MKRFILDFIFALTFAASCTLGVPPGTQPTTLPSAVTTALSADIARDLKAAGISADAQVSVSGYAALTVPHPAPAVIPQQTVMCPLNGGNATSWDPKASGRVLENTIFDSADGKGFAGVVRGDKVTIRNVDFKNLNEGLHYTGCTNLTIIGGGQVGNVLGRCDLFTDVANLTWTGDPNKTLGHAEKQSPVRADSPGIRGGTITEVHVTQIGSTFPIAGFALHCMDRVTVVDCSSAGGDFSLDSAGTGNGDEVTNCTFKNLTVTNAKLNVHLIASHCTFTGGKFTNPSGECVAITGGANNVFDGLELHSTKHGFKFYAPSPGTIIKNCILYAPGGTPIIDGGTPANDGGGNRLVVTP